MQVVQTETGQATVLRQAHLWCRLTDVPGLSLTLQAKTQSRGSAESHLPRPQLLPGHLPCHHLPQNHAKAVHVTGAVIRLASQDLRRQPPAQQAKRSVWLLGLDMLGESAGHFGTDVPWRSAGGCLATAEVSVASLQLTPEAVAATGQTKLKRCCRWILVGGHHTQYHCAESVVAMATACSLLQNGKFLSELADGCGSATAPLGHSSAGSELTSLAKHGSEHCCSSAAVHSSWWRPQVTQLKRESRPLLFLMPAGCVTPSPILTVGWWLPQRTPLWTGA